MKLCIQNIGKVRSASVDINGITVIAGENNTGKSTIGKSLFAVFNCFYKIDEKIYQERINGIENQLEAMYRNSSMGIYRSYDLSEVAKDIMAAANTYNIDSEEFPLMIVDAVTHYDDKIVHSLAEPELNAIVDRIITILSIPESRIFQLVMQRTLNAEFNDQICNVYLNSNSIIQLSIRNVETTIKITNNKVIDAGAKMSLSTEAVYIDDPFILDEVPSRIWRISSRYADHRTQLKKYLYFNRKDPNVVDEIVTNSKFERIFNKISSICEGDVVRNKSLALGYKISGTDEILDVRNLSTGLKTFGILKKLLINGYLEFNGTIILDEPEIHLHPEWQLLFAELIVLLHKEFSMHILLNTHSPYFLRAIQVFSAKHGVADKCKYYLSESVGDQATISDVTDTIDKIYIKLSKPLQLLEDMRWQND